MNILMLKQWIEEVQKAGGVDDEDTVAAVAAATDFCWNQFSQNEQRNEMSELGVKWIAAYMVSCAQNGSGDDIAAILAPARTRRAMFFRAAAKNNKFLQDLLLDAAGVPDQLSDSGIVAAGVGRVFD